MGGIRWLYLPAALQDTPSLRVLCDGCFMLAAIVFLAGIEREREFAKQGLPRPARGQVNPNAARGLADARTDFE